MRELNQADLGYAAGLIDGEGWVGLTRRKRTWKEDQLRLFYFRPVIVIGMSRLECLNHIADVLGLQTQALERGGDVYRLRIYSGTLRWFLPQLIPHLKLKWRQAEILLEFLTRCRYQGKELTVEEFIERNRLADEIHRLNKKPGIGRWGQRGKVVA